MFAAATTARDDEDIEKGRGIWRCVTRGTLYTRVRLSVCVRVHALAYVYVHVRVRESECECACAYFHMCARLRCRAGPDRMELNWTVLDSSTSYWRRAGSCRTALASETTTASTSSPKVRRGHNNGHCAHLLCMVPFHVSSTINYCYIQPYLASSWHALCLAVLPFFPSPCLAFFTQPRRSFIWQTPRQGRSLVCAIRPTITTSLTPKTTPTMAPAMTPAANL